MLKAKDAFIIYKKYNAEDFVFKKILEQIEIAAHLGDAHIWVSEIEQGQIQIGTWRFYIRCWYDVINDNLYNKLNKLGYAIQNGAVQYSTINTTTNLHSLVVTWDGVDCT